MFSKLMPQEGRFFELFNAHADLIVKGNQALAGLFDAFAKGVRDADLAEQVQAVDDIEHAADAVTRETVGLLHSSFTTPLDRDEIHHLIVRMDDILDLSQDIAEMVALYELRGLPPEAHQLAVMCTACGERIRTAIRLIHNMDNGQTILRMCDEISRLESDADRLMRSGLARLFREEPDVRELLKVKGLLELLEEVTDSCDDVAKRIEGIVLENS